MLVDVRNSVFRWMLSLVLACLLPAILAYGQQAEQEEYDYIANQVIYIGNFTHIVISYDLRYRGIAAEITAMRIDRTPNFERELSDTVESKYDGSIIVGIGGEEAKSIPATVDRVNVEVNKGEGRLKIGVKIVLKTGITEAEEASIKSIVLYMEEKAINLFLNPSLMFTSLVNRTLIVDKGMWAEFGLVHPMLVYEIGKYRVYTWMYMTTMDIAYQFNEVLIIRNPSKYSELAREFNLTLERAKRVYPRLSASEASKLRERIWEAEDKYMYSLSSLPRYMKEAEESIATEEGNSSNIHLVAMVIANAVLMIVAVYQVIKIRRRG